MNPVINCTASGETGLVGNAVERGTYAGWSVEHIPHRDVIDVDDPAAGPPVEQDRGDPGLFLHRRRAGPYRCLTADGVQLPEDTRAATLGKVLKVVQRERYEPTPHEG